MGREQHAVAELAQGGIRRQWLLLEGIDGGAADAPLVDGARGAFSSTTLPRAVLSTIAFGFISFSSASPNM